MKKYILKKRVKFQKAVSPESEKYYNSLQRINRLKVKKVILRRHKTDDLREALWKAGWHTYWRKPRWILFIQRGLLSNGVNIGPRYKA